MRLTECIVTPLGRTCVTSVPILEQQIRQWILPYLCLRTCEWILFDALAQKADLAAGDDPALSFT